MLEDGGAAIHPVPAVDVDDALDLPNRGDMDVATNDAVHTALLDVADD
jgi:hypothetical protein